MPIANRDRTRDRLELLAVLARRPVLLGRYATHVALRGARRRSLRSTYSRSVASPRSLATLALQPIELPAFDELPAPLHEPALRLRAEAAHVAAHRVDLLGSGLVDLGAEIDWHRDVKSGYRWPRIHYLDVEVTRLTDTSDAKVPWELSRSHHLLTLARAARLFREARFADELEQQLESWLTENPPGYGINWTNAMEVALRGVNWVAVAATLEPWRPLREPLRSAFVRSLQVHVRHIASNLEGTPQLRSNHYLADILGLLVLGAALEGDRRAARAFRYAHAAFEREIGLQVHDDGVGFEASLPYHGLALEIFLLAKATSDRADTPFSPSFGRSLERMLDASRALQQPGGRLPQIGDADSGRVLPAGFARGPTLDPLLWLGAAVCGDDSPLPGLPHEEVAWTLGVGAWRRLAERPVSPSPGRSAFPASGFYVLRGRRAHAVVRCGDVGQNGNGGHAHNDLLSFELSLGEPLVVDPGTYVYTSDADERNRFRSVKSHNTVVVADAEPNPLAPASLFRLKQVARPRVELWEETPALVRFRGSHDGYRTLSPPVVHRRTFTLERESDALEILDQLEGDGIQTARSYLHLAPGSAAADRGEHEWEVARGDASCRIRFFGMLDVALEEGWVSDRFGVRARAPVLVGRVAGRLPLRFGYVVVPSPVRAATRASATVRS